MTRVYVGNLPIDIRTKDVEDLFYKYGKIRDIECKTPARPPAYAFVDFERYEDAEDAIRGRGELAFAFIQRFASLGDFFSVIRRCRL